MYEIGIFNWFGYPLPMEERARLLKAAGFSHTMLWWGDEYQEHAGAKETHPEIFRKAGLGIESVHLPFRNINDLWLDNVDGAAVYEYLRACLKSAAAHDLPVAVLHVTSGHKPPPVSDIGIRRFQALADMAEKAGMILALENLRRLDYLDYVFAGVKSTALGFCYDSGHDLLYAESPYLLLDQYGDRLKALHLHDNKGVMDEHIVPGAGYIDWPLVKSKLSKYWQGPIMLECQNYGRALKRISPAAYLQMAFKAATELLTDKVV